MAWGREDAHYFTAVTHTATLQVKRGPRAVSKDKDEIVEEPGARGSLSPSGEGMFLCLSGHSVLVDQQVCICSHQQFPLCGGMHQAVAHGEKQEQTLVPLLKHNVQCLCGVSLPQDLRHEGTVPCLLGLPRNADMMFLSFSSRER